MSIKKQSMCFIVAFLFFLGQSISYVQAESGIIVDGKFQDWEGANAEFIEIQSDMIAKVAVFQDDENVYVAMQGTSTSSNISGEQITLSNGTTTKNFAIQNVDGNLNVTLRDSISYKEIEGSLAVGSLLDRANHWEFQIPKSWSGEVTQLNFKNKTIEIPTVPTQETPEEPEVPEEPETPDPNPSQRGIIIDGYYDDWKHLNYGTIHWDNPESVEGCAVLDDDRICVQLSSKKKEGRMNIDNYVIAIDNVVYSANAVKLRNVDTNGNVDPNPPNIENVDRLALKAVMQGNDGKWYILGDAYYTTQGKQKEDVEYCMSIEILEKALGVNIESGTKIELKFPSLGEGGLIIEGTSSGPYIGIGLCILVVAGTIYYKRKKSKA